MEGTSANLLKLFTDPKLVEPLFSYNVKDPSWLLILMSLTREIRDHWRHHSKELGKLKEVLQGDKVEILYLLSQFYPCSSYRLLHHFNEINIMYVEGNPDPFKFIMKAKGLRIPRLRSIVITLLQPTRTDKMQYLKEFLLDLRCKSVESLRIMFDPSVSTGKFSPFYMPILPSCTKEI